MDGMESTKGESQRKVNACDLLLRLLALVLTLAATIVLGVDKQTTVVPIQIVTTLPPLNVPVTAKWHYLSAFVFFVVSNAIGCAYAAISLLLLIVKKDGKKSLGFMITTIDVVMVALLFSGNGATAALGIMGYQGNSHVLWKKVCNVFDKFCSQVAAAIVLSLLGSLAYLLLVVSATLTLHKKSKY